MSSYIIIPNGEKEFYQETLGNKHLVKIEYPNGNKHFFEGTKGNEHLVRKEYPSGKIEHYDEKGKVFSVENEPEGPSAKKRKTNDN